jgi:hypothetical protein
MDLEYQRRKKDERYTRRVEIRRHVEKRSEEEKERGEERVRSHMKRKETTVEVCAGDSYVQGRTIEEDKSSKRHNSRSRVLREYTISSGSRDEEYEVGPPWLLQYVFTSEEDRVQSSGAAIEEYGDGAL